MDMNDNEKNIVENGAQYSDEETVVDNSLRNSKPKTDVEEENFSTNDRKGKKGFNKVRRAATIATGVGGSVAAAAYMYDHSEPEHEPEDTDQHPQNETVSQQQTSAEVSLEQPNTETVQQPEVVEVSPDDVQILGVGQVQTETGAMNVGVMNVNGEDYYLVDVNDDEVFDSAWHDDNHDNIVQEVEVIDISEEGVRVDDFNQMAENTENGNVTIETEESLGGEYESIETGPTPPEQFFAENDYMDSQDIGQIDYLDNGDTSGLV